MNATNDNASVVGAMIFANFKTVFIMFGKSTKFCWESWHIASGRLYLCGACLLSLFSLDYSLLY